MMLDPYILLNKYIVDLDEAKKKQKYLSEFYMYIRKYLNDRIPNINIIERKVLKKFQNYILKEVKLLNKRIYELTKEINKIKQQLHIEES